MRTQYLALMLIMIVQLALSGCAPPIEEPWVSNEQQLREERSRSLAETKVLRQRLASGQIDR